MDNFRVSSEVYSQIKQFTANKSINKEERLGIEMLMSQDGLDAQEQQVLHALDNQVAIGITDGRHSATLDPLSIKFPPRTPGEQARLDRQDPARREMYDTLTRAGVKESEIIATFSYLDRVGVQTQDMTELFRNQQARGHDAKDCLAALQSYGVAMESVGLPELPEPNKVHLREVAQELKAGNYRIDAETRSSNMNPNAVAQAEWDNDTIRFGSFSIGNPVHRSILLHEMVHASHDVEFEGKQHLDVSMGYSEMEAYLAEGLYMLHAQEQGEYFSSDQAFKAGMEFADAYRNHIQTQARADATVPPNAIMTLMAQEAYQAFSAKEDAFRVILENTNTYRHSFYTPQPANGISQK
ncbi:MAG: hypothetical protein ACAI44_13075 [Candidatus Sericytochromatia bacterium]